MSRHPKSVPLGAFARGIALVFIVGLLGCVDERAPAEERATRKVSDAGPNEPEAGRLERDAGPPFDVVPPLFDAGQHTFDAGPPAVPDAGQPAPDAGPPVPDAGQPAPDAGPPVPDAGPPYDVVLPVPDAGQAVPDAGPAVPDAGPPYDVVLPVTDAGPEPSDAGPLYPFEARATYYSDGPNGACGFGADPWPYVIAPAEWMNGDASLCGAFLEITSRYAEHPGEATGCSQGTTITAMVTDLCPAASNQEWCADTSVMHLDLGKGAFAVLADPSCGVVEGLEWRFVERPSDEGLRIVNKDGVNAWWYAFFVHRHRYALVKAEVKDATATTWTEALRQPWGAFLVTSTSGLTPPLSIRLTDTHGQVVVLDDVVTTLTPAATFDTNQQFPAGLGGGDPLNLAP